MKPIVLAIIACLSTTACFAADRPLIPVTVDNFVRAESDLSMKAYINDGAMGTFTHARLPTPIDKQKIVRMNRDTLYSFAVFDLDAGDVTITLPEVGKRYMMMQVIDQDHYVYDINYSPLPKTYKKDEIGTRYIAVIIRTLVDPDDEKDIVQVHNLQDKIHIDQAGKGQHEIPQWDENTKNKIRDILKMLGTTVTNTDRMFGTQQETDPIHHLIGTAVGWGGNPSSAAIYLTGRALNNDGKHIETLTLKDVPVDGFWSISVYNKQGFFVKNKANTYSINNLTAKPDKNGSIKIQFGGCNDKTINCLPIMEGWNYTVRLYRPRAEILNGDWSFPETQPLTEQ